MAQDKRTMIEKRQQEQARQQIQQQQIQQQQQVSKLQFTPHVKRMHRIQSPNDDPQMSRADNMSHDDDMKAEQFVTWWCNTTCDWCK